jgi:hypothetical protein
LRGADRDQLARAGVGWVVVENGPGSTPLALPVAYRDDDVAVYRVGGDHPPASGRGIVLAAHWVWLVALIGSAAGAAVALQQRARQRR